MNNSAYAKPCPDASTRNLRQDQDHAAMISKSARSGLIARTSNDLPANDLSLGASHGTGIANKAARNAPQLCGKRSAKQFEIAGMMAWLRKQHPKATIHEVSARTGIPAASVENWLHGRSRPSVQHFSLIIAVYGAGAFAACFDTPPDWLHHATVRQREQEIDDEIQRLQHERARCRGLSL